MFGDFLTLTMTPMVIIRRARRCTTCPAGLGNCRDGAADERWGAGPGFSGAALAIAARVDESCAGIESRSGAIDRSSMRRIVEERRQS